MPAPNILAMFRSDLEAFVSREVVEACVGDFYELSPVAGRSYYAFVDPAGGSGGDAFALAISHREGQSVVVDLVRERRPPFMPSQVIDELVLLLKSYRIGKVVGDKWAGGFPPEAFQQGRHSLRAEQAGRRATYIVTRCRCSILAASCCPRTTACSISSSALSVTSRAAATTSSTTRAISTTTSPTPPWVRRCSLAVSAATILKCSRARSTALEDEDPNTEAAREARDQEYRNQFAAAHLRAQRRAVLATMKPKGVHHA